MAGVTTMAGTLRDMLNASKGFHHPLPEAARRLAPWPLFGGQRELLRESGVLAGRSALVLAPTGSGKSVVGEAAMLRALAGDGMVFWLVTTRALARERAATLAEALGPPGIRVAASTRDDRLADEDIRAGRVDVVVTVYEKARSLFLTSPAARQLTALVVADECHLLEEPVRGPAARLLLATWRSANPQLAVVGLTAELRRPESVAELMGASIHRRAGRPVPLREGHLDLRTGNLTWKCPESGRGGSRLITVPGHLPDAGAPPLSSLLGHFEEPVLFCFPTRKETWQAAQELLDGLPLRDDGDLAGESDVSAPLRDLLARGAGLHMAEISRAERRLVERLLAAGKLRACITTTTLAEGVNLPFRTVVAFEGERGWWRPAALRHLLGRAGRPGSGPGLAIMAGYGEGPSGSLAKALSADGNGEEPRETLQLAAFALAARGSLGKGELLPALQEAIPGLTEQGLDYLLRQGQQYGFWEPRWTETGPLFALLGVGRLLAEGGVEPETLAGWRTMLRRFSAGGGSTAMAFLTLGAAQGAVVPVPLDPEERQARLWPGRLLELLEGDDSPLARYFRDFLEMQADLPRRLHQAAKAVCLLEDWRAGIPPGELAAAYRFALGLLEDFLDTARFLLGQLRKLGREMGLRGLDVEELPSSPPDSERAAHPAPDLREATLEEPAPAEPELIICEGATGEVVLQGREVSLSPRQFRLLELLARRAGEGVPYEHLEQHVWPDAQVERQQISYHRRVLERRLREEAGWPGPLIETRPAWGLRLRLGKERIRFRPLGGENGGNTGNGGGPILREPSTAVWLNSVAGAVRL